MRVNFGYLLFCVVIQYGFCIEKHSDGEKCLLPNGEDGYCKNAFKCEHVGDEQIHETNWVFCESKDDTPVICCADELTDDDFILDCDEAKELLTKETFDKCKETPSSKILVDCDDSTELQSEETMNNCKETPSSDFSLNRIFHTDDDCKALHDEYNRVANINAHESVAYGTEVEWGEFPFMVSLIQPPDNHHHCGGVIITKRHVLTAAHCMNKRNDTSVVRYGIIQFDDVHTDVKVSRITFHPEYRNTGGGNDIAILLLADDIKIGQQAFPACLHHGNQDLRINSTAEVIGFGITEDSQPSKTLLKASINIKNPEACDISFYQKRNFDSLKEHQICAGDLNVKSDTCQGDSGGPLTQTLDGNELKTVIGLTSFGQSGCDSNIIPSIYTRVSHFIEWIERVVENDFTPK
uniref:CSON015270 protein n=1 Tax=Culicoides sonorensis TaxID=179676 RepID=A0A336KU19_CULSO